MVNHYIKYAQPGKIENERMCGASRVLKVRARTQRANYARLASNEYFNGPSIFPLVIKRRISRLKMNTSRYARASS